jgi:hypothetical protein
MGYSPYCELPPQGSRWRDNACSEIWQVEDQETLLSKPDFVPSEVRENICAYIVPPSTKAREARTKRESSLVDLQPTIYLETAYEIHDLVQRALFYCGLHTDEADEVLLEEAAIEALELFRPDVRLENDRPDTPTMDKMLGFGYKSSDEEACVV